MTRINVVPVQELCDQHLLAEFRELTRIPNTINSGKAIVDWKTIPKGYTLGTGHVRFFYNKLKWLHNRYTELFDECVGRGFKVKYIWPDDVPMKLYNDWEVTDHVIKINNVRIADRLPLNARFTDTRV